MEARPPAAKLDHIESPDSKAARCSSAGREGTCCEDTRSAPRRSSSWKKHASPGPLGSARDRPRPPESREHWLPPAKADRSLDHCCTCSGNSACPLARGNDPHALRIDHCSQPESACRYIRSLRCWAEERTEGRSPQSDR